MIERASIIEETFEETATKIQGHYFLSVLAQMDDEAGTIEVEICISWDKQDKDLARVKVKAQITNPLEIVAGYLLHAAAHYGLCVGAGLIYEAGALCFESYEESRQEMNMMPLRNRCRDVFRRLKGKSNEAKQKAKNTLMGCAVHAVVAAAVPPS